MCFGLTKTDVSALKFANQEYMTQDTKKKGGRTPLPDNQKRKYSIGTKVNEVEYQILTAKKDEFKLTIYDYLRKALEECTITVKSYDEFVKIVDNFSISHLMRMCVIQSYVMPRVSPEELAAYKDLTMNLRNHGRNIRDIEAAWDIVMLQISVQVACHADMRSRIHPVRGKTYLDDGICRQTKIILSRGSYCCLRIQNHDSIMRLSYSEFILSTDHSV